MNRSQAAVRRKAQEILAESRITGLPVDVEGVIQGRGLRIQEVDTIRPGVFGAFFIDGTDAGIIISLECYSPGHRRFTFAHELGHFVIEGHVDELLPLGATLAVSQGGNFRDQQKPVEREADVFAAELLMPASLLAEVGAMPPCLDAVHQLAALCDVSLSSAAIRLMDLVDEPAAVILSHAGSVEWFAASASLREHAWARRPLRGEWIPNRSATANVLHIAAGNARDLERQASVLLCEWFDGAPAMCRVDEECMRMGRYDRVLTLLRPAELPTAEEEEEERQRAAERVREHDWRDASRTWHWD